MNLYSNYAENSRRALDQWMQALPADTVHPALILLRTARDKIPKIRQITEIAEIGLYGRFRDLVRHRRKVIFAAENQSVPICQHPCRCRFSGICRTGDKIDVPQILMYQLNLEE